MKIVKEYRAFCENALSQNESLRDWLEKEKLLTKDMNDELSVCADFLDGAYEFFDLQIEENLDIKEAFQETDLCKEDFFTLQDTLPEAVSVDDAMDDLFSDLQERVGADSAEESINLITKEFNVLYRTLMASVVRIIEVLSDLYEYEESEEI